MEDGEKTGVSSGVCARCCQGVYSGYCAHWHGGRHILLRVLLMLVILIITFGIGFKLGEFKGSFGRDYFFGRYGMHSQRPYMTRGYNYNMMDGSRTQRFTVPAPQNGSLPISPEPTK